MLCLNFILHHFVNFAQRYFVVLILAKPWKSKLLATTLQYITWSDKVKIYLQLTILCFQGGAKYLREIWRKNHLGEIWRESGIEWAVDICRTICHTYCPADTALNMTRNTISPSRCFVQHLILYDAAIWGNVELKSTASHWDWVEDISQSEKSISDDFFSFSRNWLKLILISVCDK